MQRRRTRHSVFSAVTGVYLLCATMDFRADAAAPSGDAENKAVLLFHLTQFVTWPTSALERATFDIGILGPDPFGPALEAAVKDGKVHGKPIRVLRSSRALPLAECPLVYVSPQAEEPLPRIFRDLSKPPSISVGESEDFVEKGGMICFRKTGEEKVRLQIHLNRIRERGFNVSAQLLRVSDVVSGTGGAK